MYDEIEQLKDSLVVINDMIVLPVDYSPGKNMAKLYGRIDRGCRMICFFPGRDYVELPDNGKPEPFRNVAESI